jgi:hypothetical protein
MSGSFSEHSCGDVVDDLFVFSDCIDATSSDPSCEEAVDDLLALSDSAIASSSQSSCDEAVDNSVDSLGCDTSALGDVAGDVGEWGNTVVEFAILQITTTSARLKLVKTI